MSGKPEIQFGRLDVAQPAVARTPHEDRRYAVAACGRPKAGELAVYVDLDALLAMETHALSDTSVELGGVLLGGQYVDADGKPFVVISDCLRASHYESTRGSFKFTHDTWSEITRQRDQFSLELEIVGWYHTHPDWGVFLSGMDTFICDHFFNRPLDVALVIDPCRGDRGFFEWTTGPRRHLSRTAGFYVTTSRHRRDFLQYFIACYEGDHLMPAAPSFLAGQAAPPVVHLHDRRGGWLGPAVVGLLIVQVCLTLLIAARLLLPGGAAAPADGGEQVAAASAEPSESDTAVTASQLEAQRQFLDRVVGRLDGGEEGLVSLLEEERRQNELLRAAQRGYVAVEGDNSRLTKALQQAEEQRDQYQGEVARLEELLTKAVSRNKEEVAALEKEIEGLHQQLDEGGHAGLGSLLGLSWTIWIALACAVVAVVIAGAWFSLREPSPAAADEGSETAARHDT